MQKNIHSIHYTCLSFFLSLYKLFQVKATQLNEIFGKNVFLRNAFLLIFFSFYNFFFSTWAATVFLKCKETPTTTTIFLRRGGGENSPCTECQFSSGRKEGGG